MSGANGTVRTVLLVMLLYGILSIALIWATNALGHNGGCRRAYQEFRP